MRVLGASSASVGALGAGAATADQAFWAWVRRVSGSASKPCKVALVRLAQTTAHSRHATGAWEAELVRHRMTNGCIVVVHNAQVDLLPPRGTVAYQVVESSCGRRRFCCCWAAMGLVGGPGCEASPIRCARSPYLAFRVQSVTSKARRNARMTTRATRVAVMMSSGGGLWRPSCSLRVVCPLNG